MSADEPAAGPRRSPPPWAAQALVVLRKDATLELRSGEVLVTSGFFGFLVVVVASLAFYLGPETRGQVASGAIWLPIAFATVLALGRLWQRERDDGALDGLLLTPLLPSALFAGKALGLATFLVAIEALVIPVAALFFSLDLVTLGPGLVSIALAATPGIAATGTLFGAMTARTRARDLVLAVVLFPLLAPALLTAVVATRELCGGASVAELSDYLTLLGIFDVVFVAGGLALFGLLVDT
ncbi:MAG: heme exporter protein CcmB [Deltaproteobacteria bacterium]|nr:heme exporter protein CcmB [Deltaproteobacteria bacterium]